MSAVDRRIEHQVALLEAARDAFLAALADVEPELLSTPGLVGEWSARDLVFHVAFWSRHGADALALADQGRGDQFDYDKAQTDAINARVFEEGRGVDVQAAMEREATAFADLRARVAAIEPSVLGLRLGNGDSVEEVIRYDGYQHYAEHTRDLRAWWAEGEEGLDEVDEVEMSGDDGEAG